MARLRARLWSRPWARLRSRLRVLLSLLMVTAGAILGGLGLSGYYDAHRPQGQAAIASVGNPQFPAKLQARQRFLAIDDKPPAPPPKPKVVAPKVVAKAPPANTKPAVKAQPAVKDKRPQQAAAPWFWSLFGN